MDTSREVTVKVAGMSCSHCEARVKNGLESMEGITNVEADNKSETVKIAGTNIDLEEVKETINHMGYRFIGEHQV